MNITSTIENNTYEDPSFGAYGVFAFRFVLGVCLFTYFIATGIVLLIREKPALTENYIGIIGGIAFFSSIIIWLASNIIYASQTIQKIVFTDRYIALRLYFFRKSTFDIKNLTSIHDFKITKLMSQVETFPKNGTGFFIQLKNGKKYRVSPNIQNFAVLKKQLLELIEKNNKPVTQTNI